MPQRCLLRPLNHIKIVAALDVETVLGALILDMKEDRILSYPGKIGPSQAPHPSLLK